MSPQTQKTQNGGDTIQIIDIQEGSIKLIIEGSEEDIERLLIQILSGELTELDGFPVEDVQILSESLEDGTYALLTKKPWFFTFIEGFKQVFWLKKQVSDYSCVSHKNSESSKQKWRLVEEIVTNPIRGRDLSGTDLSDADLSGAFLIDANLSEADLSDSDLCHTDLRHTDLRGANLNSADLMDAKLSGADLMDAKLSGAKLSGADLNGANLSGANLSGANLNLADLGGADLSGADLSGIQVKKTRFRDNLGITEELKQDLIKRGAIFDDSPGDRSGILTRV